MTAPKRRILTEDAAKAAALCAVSDPVFWEKVRAEGDCLVYTGYRDRQGYGSVVRKAVSPVPILAHRYAYYLAHGLVEQGAIIRHTCDNPPCVLPAHLLTGTQADNIADRQARGRHRPGRLHGEQHPAHVLDDEDVLWIRRTARSGKWSTSDMARYFQVDPSTISRIIRGRNWRHLPMDGKAA